MNHLRNYRQWPYITNCPCRKPIGRTKSLNQLIRCRKNIGRNRRSGISACRRIKRCLRPGRSQRLLDHGRCWRRTRVWDSLDLGCCCLDDRRNLCRFFTRIKIPLKYRRQLIRWIVAEPLAQRRSLRMDCDLFRHQAVEPRYAVRKCRATRQPGQPVSRQHDARLQRL